MAASTAIANGGDDYELPPRKKPKVSELPLSSIQRASIDGMLHTFKKKGEFDSLRKKTFQQYNESADRGIFENSLRKFTTDEIEREPVKYLKPDRRLAAPLIEGAAARAQIYEAAEENIAAYIDQQLASAEQTLREIRRKEIGDEAANAELERGTKSDEAYAAEADERRVLRAKKFAEEERLRLKKEAQDRKKKELEALKKKQEQLMRETERLQRDNKRRLERDEWKKLEKERERERIKKFNEERDKAKKEAEEREQALQAEREKKEKERQEREQKRLEEEALNRLLREGREREERDRRPELDRGDMDVPTRPRFNGITPRSTHARDDVRPRGPMSASTSVHKEDRSREEDDYRREPRYRSRSPRRGDDRPRRLSRGSYREGTMRRESYYRDLSAEREAWKAKAKRPPGEDGELVEGSTRARSRSRDSHRRRERTRSPPRRVRERSRGHSPPRRRERSRSPLSIDRYVPGAPPSRRPRDASRDRSRDRHRRDRSRERRDYSRDRRDRSRDRRDRSREHHRDRHEDDRRSARYDDRPRAVDIDRYVPGSPRRRERSRSRDRRREKSKDAPRERNAEKTDRERDRK